MGGILQNPKSPLFPLLQMGRRDFVVQATSKISPCPGTIHWAFFNTFSWLFLYNFLSVINDDFSLASPKRSEGGAASFQNKSPTTATTPFLVLTSTEQSCKVCPRVFIIFIFFVKEKLSISPKLNSSPLYIPSPSTNLAFLNIKLEPT